MGDVANAVRENVLALLRTELPDYLVRWADAKTTRGDFDGRDATLDVFNVPADRQRDVRRRIRAPLAASRALLGQPIVVVFHTPEATAKYHADVVHGVTVVAEMIFDTSISICATGDISGPFAISLDPSTIRLPVAA